MQETMQFGPLTIHFDELVLRPRPWTLAQSEWGGELAASSSNRGRILELCAGVGQIGLALARTCADQDQPRSLVLVDADRHACDLAEINAAGAQLPLPAQIRHGRLDATLEPDEQFAIILADPPWVPSEQTMAYPDDPLSAIDGGKADGLDLARICVQVIGAHLALGGSSILQLGTMQQAEIIRDHVTQSPQLGLKAGETRAVPEANGVLLLLTRD